MRFRLARVIPTRTKIGCGVLVASCCLAGCAAAPSAETPTTRSQSTREPCDSRPAIRYGRYRLVELVPDSAQVDLMQQVVDVVLPPNTEPSVGDAVRHLLRRSGYRLCERDDDTARLDSLPLPSSQLHMGPVTLKDALQMLIGGVGSLEVREDTRTVCVVPVASHADTPPMETTP